MNKWTTVVFCNSDFDFPWRVNLTPTWSELPEWASWGLPLAWKFDTEEDAIKAAEDVDKWMSEICIPKDL